MKTVRLSLKSAKVLLGLLSSVSANLQSPSDRRVIAELESAVVPHRPKPLRAERLKKKRAKRVSKREKRAEVREAVMNRSVGLCEACVKDLTLTDPGELDHFFGKARAESVESCWLLCRACHRAKTDNNPSAAWWLDRFDAHARFYGYTAESKRARARLEGICAVRKAEAGR
jgi:5-methylcytosine-specific restriction endonuclease McrA